MELKIYKNINECHNLWNIFSPNKNLFDMWDFRQCFYNKQDYKPYFIAGLEGKKIVGIIPLYYIKNRDRYTYFGDWFPERNSFFLREKSNLPQLLEKCPDNTFLYGIDPKERTYYNFKEDEYTYFIDLSKYNNNFERYFTSFNKKKQKNFKRDLKNIPRFKVFCNRIKDFNRMIELNIRQFDEDSIYNDNRMKNAIRKVINTAHKKGILNMLSVEINGKVEGIDVGIKTNGWYTVVTGSSNNQKIPNIGKLMTVLSIQNAIKKRARVVDFLASSEYWKNQWKFDKEMLLKFEK